MDHNPTSTSLVSTPTTKQQWQAVVEAWKASGEKQAPFCRARGISRRAFVNWKAKFYPSTKPRRVALVPVAIKPTSAHPVTVQTEPFLAIVTENGCRIEIRGNLESRVLQQVLEVVREVRR